MPPPPAAAASAGSTGGPSTGADPWELFEALEALREWQARSGTECHRPSCPCEDDARGWLPDEEDEVEEEGFFWQSGTEPAHASPSSLRHHHQREGEGESSAAAGDGQQRQQPQREKQRRLPSMRLRGLIDLDEFMSSFEALAAAQGEGGVEGEAGGLLEPQAANSSPSEGEQWDPHSHCHFHSRSHTDTDSGPGAVGSPGLCRCNTRISDSASVGEEGREGEEEREGEDGKAMWSQFLSWRDLESSCALLDSLPPEGATVANAPCPGGGPGPQAEESRDRKSREGGEGGGWKEKGWEWERSRMRILSVDLTTWRQEPDGTEWCSPAVEIGRSASTPPAVLTQERGVFPWR